MNQSITSVGLNAFDNVADPIIPVYKETFAEFSNITGVGNNTKLTHGTIATIDGVLTAWTNKNGPIVIPAMHQYVSRII